MAFAMIFSVMTVGTVSYAAAGDVWIEGASSNSNSIDKGDDFTYSVQLTSKVDPTTLSNVKVKINSSNFQMVNKAFESVTGGWTVNGTEWDNTVALSLEKISTGNQLEVVVEWTDGSGTYTDKMYRILSEAEEDDDEITNTGKYKPVVTVAANSEIPVFTAGENVTLQIPLENLSKDTAKDVRIKITTDPKDLPFIMDKATYTDTISYLRSTKTEIAEIKAQVSPTAQNKIYPIELEFTYTNVHKDDFTTTSTYYIKIVNNEIEPTVGVTKYQFVKESVVAGVDDAMLLTVENRGTVPAYNAKITLSGFDKDGIRLINDINSKNIASVGGGEESSVYYNIAASPKAKSDTYELTATIEYTDEQGNEYKTESMVYVPVEGKDSAAIELEVQNVKSKEKVVAGENYTVAFDVKNIGVLEAEKVMVSVRYPDDFIPKSSPKKMIKNLKGSDVESFSFDFMAKNEAKTKFNDFYIVLEYYADASSEDKGTFEEYCGVMVDGKSGLGRPKIIVKNYALEEAEVAMAGQEFILNVDLYNTSTDDVIKNIKVTMESDDGVFSPVDSSSSFFVEYLGRQEVKTVPLKFKTKVDASVKVYNLTLTMEYEDGEGNAYDSQEQPYKEVEKLGIQVSQPVRLELSEPMLPMDAMVGMGSDLEMEFFNMGKSTMYNMMVKLEGNFQVQGSNYFVGNFESGRSEYFSATVIPEEEGEAVGKMIFEYEDALGNIEKVEQEISFFVSGAGEMGEFTEGDFEGDFGEGDFGEEDPGAASNWKTPAAILAVMALIAGGVWFHKKRKAKMLAEMEDDDE
jgi:hypothetical protein